VSILEAHNDSSIGTLYWKEASMLFSGKSWVLPGASSVGFVVRVAVDYFKDESLPFSVYVVRLLLKRLQRFPG